MPDELVAGLDVGTNATKCLVCDRQGRVAAHSRQEYALQHPRQGWVEQDPEELWGAVLHTLGQAAAQVRGRGRIAALSLSSQGGTTIVVGEDGQPLRPAISWLDARAGDEGKRIVAELGQEAIYEAAGWEVSTSLPLLHIAWLREHERETYERAGHYLFVNDFVLSRLTGRRVMDPSDAALTLLYDAERNQWDARLCETAGVRWGQLSPIEDSGEPVGALLPEVAAQLGLSADVLVVNGGHDQYCAALGAGVVTDGDVLLSCGTAWVLLAAADRLIRDPQHTFAPGRHVLPGMWGLLCSMPAAGASMEWLVRQVVSGPDDEHPRYDLLDPNLQDPEPGAGGLLFLPLLAGIEAATMKAGLWGTLTGLSLGHTRWDVAQALMEGVALELRWILERLRTVGYEPQVIQMVGGATRSRLWPQIVADVTGLRLGLPDVAEAAARGAAMLAGMGCGLYGREPPWPAEARRIEPRSGRRAAYDDLFARFRRLEGALREALADRATAS